MLGTGSKPVAILLIVLMAIGSVLMWLVIPFAWIYGVSHAVKSSQPTMGPYVLLLFGIPTSMVVMGKLLGKLNRIYGEVTQTTPEMRVRMPWHRSLRGERDSGRPRTVLDVVMVVSVTVAMALFGFWFFVFAGSSIPS